MFVSPKKCELDEGASAASKATDGYASMTEQKSSVSTRLPNPVFHDPRSPNPRSSMSWQAVQVQLFMGDQRCTPHLFVQVGQTAQQRMQTLENMGLTPDEIKRDYAFCEDVFSCHPQSCGPNRPPLGDPNWPVYPAGGDIDFHIFSAEVEKPISPDMMVPRKPTGLEDYLKVQQASGASVKYLPQHLEAPTGEQQEAISGVFSAKIIPSQETTKSTVEFLVVGMGTPTPLAEEEQFGVLEAAGLYKMQQKYPDRAEELTQEFMQGEIAGQILPIFSTGLGRPEKPCDPRLIHVAGESANYKPIQWSAKKYPLLNALYGEQSAAQGLSNRVETDAKSILQNLLVLPEVAKRWLVMHGENTRNFSKNWAKKSSVEKEALAQQWVQKLCADIKTHQGLLPEYWQQLVSDFNWKTHFTGYSYGATAMNNVAAVLLRLGLVNSESKVITFAASAGMAALSDDMQTLVSTAKVANFVGNRDPMPASNLETNPAGLMQPLPSESVFILAPDPQESPLQHAGLNHAALGYRGLNFGKNDKSASDNKPFYFAEPVSGDMGAAVVNGYVLEQGPLACLPMPPNIQNNTSIIQLSYRGLRDELPCMRSAPLYWPVESVSKL